jgi:hypothetical protein
MDLMDICRIFHWAATEYTVFSVVHGTFSKIDDPLVHKANLKK